MFNGCVCMCVCVVGELMPLPKPKKEEKIGKKMATDMIRKQPLLVEKHVYVVGHDPLILPESMGQVTRPAPQGEEPESTIPFILG